MLSNIADRRRPIFSNVSVNHTSMLRLDPRTLEALSRQGDVREALDFDPYDHKSTIRALISEVVGLGSGCVDDTARVANS